MTYMTEKGTVVLRVNVDEVVLGGGKIQLPVLLEDWTNSKSVTQYCMRGSLHPDTLIIAVENFTQKRVREGLLVYEQSKKAGRLIFDFAQLQSGAIYATSEDNIMLERASEPPYINFTFGRNLYWYVKSQKEKGIASSDGTGSNKENLEEQGIKGGMRKNRKGMPGSPSSGLLSPLSASKSSKSPSKAGQQQQHAQDNGPAGVPPPPPPPGGLRMGPGGIPAVPGTPPPPPFGKKRQRKVRQLYWNRIPQNQLAGTIWKEKGSPSRVAVEIDVQELEDMFSLSPMKDSSDKISMITTSNKSDTGKDGAQALPKVQLLDLKRANNGAVLLSQFKSQLSFSQIRNALITMDHDNILTIENLISLKYLFPLTDQERHDLVNFKGDAQIQCGVAEQFYLATLDVPRPDLRIRMLIFRNQYQDVSQHLEASVQVLRQGSQELVDSDKLAQVLQLILKLGRALNDASHASGFRLDSLSKLADTKAKDKKTSILDYLIAVTMRQKPELINFFDELPTLHVVAKLPTETIQEGLKEIKDTLDALKLELELISRLNMANADLDAKVKSIVSEILEKEEEKRTLQNERKVRRSEEKLKRTQARIARTQSEGHIPSGEESSSSPSWIDTHSPRSSPSKFDAKNSTSSKKRSAPSTPCKADLDSPETLEPVVVSPIDSKFADAYFRAHMETFYDHTLALYLATKKRNEAAVHSFEKAVRYFGEDAKTSQPSSFFSLITSFIDQWKASKAKLDKAASDREKAELKAKKEEEKAKLKLQKKMEAEASQASSQDSTAAEEQGSIIVDNKQVNEATTEQDATSTEAPQLLEITVKIVEQEASPKDLSPASSDVHNIPLVTIDYDSQTSETEHTEQQGAPEEIPSQHFEATQMSTETISSMESTNTIEENTESSFTDVVASTQSSFGQLEVVTVLDFSDPLQHPLSPSQDNEFIPFEDMESSYAQLEF
jgi:hypothetical protein